MNRLALTKMLRLQDRLNSVIDPTWLTAQYPWHRAIMVEAVEALDHYGWKWWKAPPVADVGQIKLELVDIWHFALSLTLDRNSGEIELTASMLDDFFSKLADAPDCFGDVSMLSITELFDLLAGTAGAQQMINCSAFAELMQRFDLTWEELYRIYIGKNVLNLFRQANGYKDRTYIKDWLGQEDNAVLEGLMVASPDATPEELEASLNSFYDSVKLAAA